MTQEIIQMARDSGMELYGLGKNRARFVYHLEAFAKLVAEAEREACAKACEQLSEKMTDMAAWGAQECFKAIRARGQA
jgi:hypothetical protein